MSQKPVLVSVQIDGDVVFSRYTSEGGSNGITTLDENLLQTAIKHLNSAIQDVQPYDTPEALLSSIHIKINDELAFNHNVPIEGTPFGLMTNNIEINKKLKQILENALAQIEVSLITD